MRDRRLHYWRAHPEHLHAWKSDLVGESEDTATVQKILSLTDEELLARASESYDEFLETALQTLGSGTSYADKYMDMRRLIDGVEDKAGRGDPVVFLIEYVRGVLGYYRLYTRNAVYFNAIRAAIGIYRVQARTGRLPATIPDGLPKDPYSANDFEYLRVAGGFVLRSRVKAIDESHVCEFEFGVRR